MTQLPPRHGEEGDPLHCGQPPGPLAGRKARLILFYLPGHILKCPAPILPRVQPSAACSLVESNAASWLAGSQKRE